MLWNRKPLRFEVVFAPSFDGDHAAHVIEKAHAEGVEVVGSPYRLTDIESEILIGGDKGAVEILQRWTVEVRR